MVSVLDCYSRCRRIKSLSGMEIVLRFRFRLAIHSHVRQQVLVDISVLKIISPWICKSIFVNKKRDKEASPRDSPS